LTTESTQIFTALLLDVRYLEGIKDEQDGVPACTKGAYPQGCLHFLQPLPKSTNFISYFETAHYYFQDEQSHLDLFC
jgi:hypothetical protein